MADREDVNILRDQIDALKESFGIKSKITENDRTQIGVAKQLARFAEQQVDNKSKQLLTERSIADIQDDISQAKILQDKIEAKIGTKNTVKNRLLKEFSDLNTKITDDLEAQREAAENLEKSVGGIGIIIKAINKIPFIKDLVNSEKVFESMVTAAEKGTSTLQAAFKSISEQIDNLSGPLAFGLFVDSLFEANNSVVDIGRNLGVSAFEASKLRNQLVGVRIEAQDIRVTTETLIEAQNTLNSAFNTAALFNGEIAVGAARALDSQLMSVEAVSQLAGDAARLGMSFDEALITQEESVNQINAQTGASISLREVLDASNKISGQIRAQLGSNPAEIARAVTQAKALGFELEQIAAAGKQILDFESSIANELEAELLTGKQLNLERARLAALTGDLETLTSEISANVGDFNDFTSLNVIQQEAIANAVGMTADELANSLVTEENRAQLLQDAIAANNTQSVQALQQLSTQEAFAKSVEQVKGLFVDIVGLLSPVLTIIGKLAELASFLPIQFALLGGIIGKILLPRLAKSAILAAIVNPLALAGAGLAIGGIMALTRSRSGNDVAMSNNMLVTKNAGTIKLNNDDTVIAGTDLGGGIDYDKMAMAMSKAQVNVSTKYNSFRAYSTTSNGGRYQSSVRYESKFV